MMMMTATRVIPRFLCNWNGISRNRYSAEANGSPSIHQLDMNRKKIDTAVNQCNINAVLL
jgi:hypothetical protein